MVKRPIIIQKMQPSGEWADYYRCRAYVNGLSGSEYWAAAAQQAENTVVFEVRWCCRLSEIHPQICRIVFRGSVYDVKSVDNVQYNDRFIKIKAVMKHGRDG